MTLKHQKIISALLIALAAFGGLEALTYIINRNQPLIFWQTASAIFLYLALKISLLYDLHFKNPGALNRAIARHESVPHWLHRFLSVTGTALLERSRHILRKHHWQQLMNFLILPGLLFWSTAILIYLDFDLALHRSKEIHVLIFLSGSALICVYWYLKEAFLRKTEIVDRDIFAGLAAVKIYTAALAFAAVFGLTKRLCQPRFFVAIVFCLTFLLIYQALAQHKMARVKNFFWPFLISVTESMAAYAVYRLWPLNVYTAGVALAALYNLMWGTFHYHLDRALTKKVFLEILLICLLAGLMVFSVTNFKARLLDSCNYYSQYISPITMRLIANKTKLLIFLS